MLIKKNYLNFKLKGLKDNNITPFNNNNLNDNNLNKLLLDNKDFNDKLRKA
jgi:hypothetical protein